jgi:hypothetical protein
MTSRAEIFLGFGFVKFGFVKNVSEWRWITRPGIFSNAVVAIGGSRLRVFLRCEPEYQSGFDLDGFSIYARRLELPLP